MVSRAALFWPNPVSRFSYQAINGWAFIDAYRSVHCYDATGKYHAVRLTIDLAGGGELLQWRRKLPLPNATAKARIEPALMKGPPLIGKLEDTRPVTILPQCIDDRDVNSAAHFQQVNTGIQGW